MVYCGVCGSGPPLRVERGGPTVHRPRAVQRTTEGQRRLERARPRARSNEKAVTRYTLRLIHILFLPCFCWPNTTHTRRSQLTHLRHYPPPISRSHSKTHQASTCSTSTNQGPRYPRAIKRDGRRNRLSRIGRCLTLTPTTQLPTDPLHPLPSPEVPTPRHTPARPCNALEIASRRAITRPRTPPARAQSTPATAPARSSRPQLTPT